MAAENADEDSERDTSGSGSGDPTSDTSMAADDANENAELDSSAPEQTPFPIQKESKKQDGFTYPKASKNDRKEAAARILKALDKVDRSVHFNPQSKLDTATLYMGNLDYNASDEDIAKALVPFFPPHVSVDDITIPRVNGRSLYGFIDISWVRGVLMKESDVCTVCNNGRLKVNSRLIYFRELRNKK